MLHSYVGEKKKLEGENVYMYKYTLYQESWNFRLDKLF